MTITFFAQHNIYAHTNQSTFAVYINIIGGIGFLKNVFTHSCKTHGVIISSSRLDFIHDFIVEFLLAHQILIDLK